MYGREKKEKRREGEKEREGENIHCANPGHRPVTPAVSCPVLGQRSTAHLPERLRETQACAS